MPPPTARQRAHEGGHPGPRGARDDEDRVAAERGRIVEVDRPRGRARAGARPRRRRPPWPRRAASRPRGCRPQRRGGPRRARRPSRAPRASLFGGPSRCRRPSLRAAGRGHPRGGRSGFPRRGTPSGRPAPRAACASSRAGGRRAPVRPRGTMPPRRRRRPPRRARRASTRRGSAPPRARSRSQLVSSSAGGRLSTSRTFTPRPSRRRAQGEADSARVGHHHHPASALERDAGRAAQRERRRAPRDGPRGARQATRGDGLRRRRFPRERGTGREPAAVRRPQTAWPSATASGSLGWFVKRARTDGSSAKASSAKPCRARLGPTSTKTRAPASNSVLSPFANWTGAAICRERRSRMAGRASSPDG